MTQERRLELAWAEHEGRACIRIRGWEAGAIHEMAGLATSELGLRLAAFPSELVEAEAGVGALQPMAGRFEVSQDSVCFIPRLPFKDGTRYSLLVHSAFGESQANGVEVWTIQRRARAGAPAASVVAIYPSADDLPVNQLKLYVHFSRPMSEGWATRAVHVSRADTGEPVGGVFLQMEPGLWDRERRRLTLLLDPGRIKRGLVPNREAGYPLIEGVPVIVSIDREFRDGDGQPLRAGAQRRYAVGPPVRTRVNPKAWRSRFPASGSMDPLTVEFDRPLDHALLARSLSVRDGAAVPLAGRGFAGPGERSWRFEPQSPWGEGQHALTIDPILEDLAGNSLLRVFDRDLGRAEDTPAEARHIAIEFTCVSGATGCAPTKLVMPGRSDHRVRTGTWQLEDDDAAS